MTEQECQVSFDHAMKNRLKVNFQMNDTPDDKFILFHPYASLMDAFDGLSVIGLVEHHHTSPETNYLARPKLSGVKRIDILNEKFEPDHEKWKGLKLYTIDVLLKA